MSFFVFFVSFVVQSFLKFFFSALFLKHDPKAADR